MIGWSIHRCVIHTKLNYKDYGFKNNDQLILELTRRGFINREIGENKLAVFSYEKHSTVDEKPRVPLDIDYNKINVLNWLILIISFFSKIKLNYCFRKKQSNKG